MRADTKDCNPLHLIYSSGHHLWFLTTTINYSLYSYIPYPLPSTNTILTPVTISTRSHDMSNTMRELTYQMVTIVSNHEP